MADGENKEKRNFLQMLFSKNNKPDLIPKDIHKIDNSLIEIDAKKVIYRLKRFGYQAYIVGGAIRDLLLGKKPKDFDVATDAKPNEIKKIFCNARLIGRRFKLVHIIFKDRIIETATFRANIKTKKGIIINDNKFGTIEEDALRRDFGINALYYDIESENIIDYVNGYKDIQKRRIRTLKKADISFLEDPVRMIRAIKYSILLNCKIEKKIENSIKKNSSQIKKCSPFRLLEEINKIIKAEKAKDILVKLASSKLLKHFIPIIDEEIRGDNSKLYLKRLEIFDKEKDNLKEIEEKIDLFWSIMLFEKVKSQINNEDPILSISTCLKNYLYVIKSPRKTVENITKIYYNYIKINGLIPEPKEELNSVIARMRRTKYYNVFVYFVKIIGDKEVEEIFKPLKKRNSKHKKFRSKKKKKFFKMVKTEKNSTVPN